MPQKPMRVKPSRSRRMSRDAKPSLPKRKQPLNKSRRSGRSRYSALRNKKSTTKSKYRSVHQLNDVTDTLRSLTPDGVTVNRVENAVYDNYRNWTYDVVLECGGTELSVTLSGLGWLTDETIIPDLIKQHMYETEASWVPWIIRNFKDKFISDLQRKDPQATKWLLRHSATFTTIDDLSEELADLISFTFETLRQADVEVDDKGVPFTDRLGSDVS